LTQKEYLTLVKCIGEFMQTHFTEKQLENSDNKATEKIFKKCVHCGMCNATCPTHQILGDEL
jgi:glycolate oxidase iron-sulfur subunit